jgi:putative sporulation protein YtxC
MEQLSIGIKEGDKEVSNFLLEYVELLKNKGLNIEARLSNLGNMVFIDYTVRNSKFNNSDNIFKHYIADIISDIIINIYQKRMVQKIINECYYYFKESEKDVIKAKAMKYLSEGELVAAEGITYNLSRKAKILKTVIEYLDLNDEMIIEGFINFRLRFLLDTIEDAVEKAVEELLIEKEYKEFIRVLQYFVDIQEPKADVVNVLASSNKRYLLFDKDYKVINNEFLEEIAEEITDSDINYDDLLISSLITIAPMKIIIHLGYNDYYNNSFNEIIKVIENVFVDKVTICKGCEFCSKTTNEITNKKH